jgi:hypothetical protein
MGDPVEIKIVATGAAGAAQAIEQPAQALRKVEEAAGKATAAVEQTAAAARAVGANASGVEPAAQALRTVEAGAERAAAALARSQAATRSMTSVFGGRATAMEIPLDLTTGLDPKALGDLDNAGFLTARWSTAAQEGARAADGLRRAAGGAAGGIVSAGHAAGNGNEKMQALGTAMLMMTGSAGPLSQAFRAFGAAALSSNGNVSQLWSTLKGGGAMFAGMYVTEQLASNWRDLGSAVDEVNTALANVGQDANYSRIEAVSDMISRALGMTALAEKITGGSQPETPAASDEEMAAATAAAREKQTKTWQGRMRPKSAQERVAERMQADKGGVWDEERYRREVKKEEAADAAKAAREEEAKSLQARRLQISNSVWGRVQSAQATGIADPHAQRLLDMGVSAWADVGGGDAQEGAERLEARWDAEEKAAKEVADKRLKLSEKIADTEKRLAEAIEAEKDRRAREAIRLERERLDRGLAATVAAAQEAREVAEKLRGQMEVKWGGIMPVPGKPDAVPDRDAIGGAAEERRKRKEDEARAKARYDRQVEAARRRQAQLMAGGLDKGEARQQMTQRGRDLLAFDEDRRRLADRDGQAKEMALRADDQKSAVDKAMEGLRQQEMALGRDEIAASVELTAELARLREDLAALPSAGTPAGQAAAPETPGPAPRSAPEGTPAEPEPAEPEPWSGTGTVTVETAPAAQAPEAPAAVLAPVETAVTPAAQAPDAPAAVLAPVETAVTPAAQAPEAPAAVLAPVETAVTPAAQAPEAPAAVLAPVETAVTPAAQAAEVPAAVLAPVETAVTPAAQAPEAPAAVLAPVETAGTPAAQIAAPPAAVLAPVETAGTPAAQAAAAPAAVLAPVETAVTPAAQIAAAPAAVLAPVETAGTPAARAAEVPAAVLAPVETAVTPPAQIAAAPAAVLAPAPVPAPMVAPAGGRPREAQETRRPQHRPSYSERLARAARPESTQGQLRIGNLSGSRIDALALRARAPQFVYRGQESRRPQDAHESRAPASRAQAQMEPLRVMQAPAMAASGIGGGMSFAPVVSELKLHTGLLQKLATVGGVV